MRKKSILLSHVFNAAFIFSFCFATTAFAQSAGNQDEHFKLLADEYIHQVYLPLNPTLATEAGDHTYDNQLEDYTQAGMQKEIKQLTQFMARLNDIRPAQLSEEEQGDRELLLNNIRSRLLTLTTIKPWQKDPDIYSTGITNSAFVIMKRNYASQRERLRCLIAREKKMPAVLLTARNNLQNPPKIYTRIALQQLPSVIDFFQNDIPAAFANVNDPVLKKDFATANAHVITALRQYQSWLKTSVLPHANGDFRIGAEAYRKKLQYDEMVDMPLPKLLAIGLADLHKNQQELSRVAHEIDPTKTTSEVIKEFGADHPEPDKLLATFSGTFTGLIEFIKQKEIITIPSDVLPILEETPPFMRATTFASMDTPGPYEVKTKQAYFNVTLPDPNWSKEKIDEFMTEFNSATIISTAEHETYPGHYVQFLWMNTLNDPVRKLFGANSNSEGWAHYCEQMMFDAGYGQSNDNEQQKRANLFLHVGQLQDALLRDARFIVGIKMHTGQMTLKQAVDFFVQEAYQSPVGADLETKRGTADPTYLYYTLGKLQILKLRADLQAKEGKAFNLKQFHDDFMRQGFAPIKIVRKALMHDDTPTL